MKKSIMQALNNLRVGKIWYKKFDSCIMRKFCQFKKINFFNSAKFYFFNGPIIVILK